MKSRLLLSMAMTFLLLSAFIGCSKQEKTGETAAEKKAEVVPGEMVRIPAGEFIMGSDVAPNGEKKAGTYSPAHKVNLPEYWIDKYEVTNGEYLKFVTEGSYKPEGDWRTHYLMGKENLPVAQLTLNDAKEYCKWAGKRLPTEEEWETAARGEKGLDYPWGNKWEPERANTYEMGHRERVDVGSMAGDVSPYGAHDMMGNVVEWTTSEYKAYPGGPKNPDYSKGYFVVRGGSWAVYGNDKKEPYKIWLRGAYLPKSQYGIGCRCAGEQEVKPK
ncbi:MAG TPA: SUMF1/EgtB/PvdO family nonheme iron enzyme [Acidobacteriota bacterium]